jgi:hypothetical protein
LLSWVFVAPPINLVEKGLESLNMLRAVLEPRMSPAVIKKLLDLGVHAAMIADARSFGIGLAFRFLLGSLQRLHPRLGGGELLLSR